MKIIQLENARNRVLDILSESVSERTKLKALAEFFRETSAHFGMDVLRSYYLEFSHPFISLINETNLAFLNPDSLKSVLTVVETYENRFAQDLSERTIAAGKSTVCRMLAETEVLLGEWDGALDRLEKITGEKIGKRERTQISKRLDHRTGFQEIVNGVSSVLETTHPGSFEICSEMMSRWTEQYVSPKSDRVFLLFVEKPQTEAVSNADGGMILPVHLRVRLRPESAEEDAFRINNDWVPRTGPFAHRMKEALESVRSLLKDRFPKAAANRHYSFQFTIAEKNAAYFGNSLEAPLAVLAAGGMVNAFYGGPLVRFNPQTVLTGGVDSQGRLVPVDEAGLGAKIQAVFFSPVRRIIVPWDNLTSAMSVLDKLKQTYPNRYLSLESAERLDELFDDRNLTIHKPVTPAIRFLAGFRRNRIRAAWAAVATALILILSLLVLPFLLKDRNPVALDILGRYLVASNAAGQELWKYDFGVRLTRQRYVGDQQHRAVWRDVNRDGKNELLFGVYENDLPEQSGWIYCFDSDGRVMFRIRTGREMTFGGETYEDQYRVAFVDAADLNGDGRDEILSISHQFPWFPCVVNVWNLKGEKLGEYWHAGQFESLNYLDLDGDGVREIIALGQNNEYRCAAAAVLKLSCVEGASPQTVGGHFEAGGLPFGRELYYLRFPQSGIFRLTGSRDFAFEVQDRKEGLQFAIGNGGSVFKGPTPVILYFVLGKDMSFSHVSIGDSYRISMTRLAGNDYSPNLETGLDHILYFDGTNWTDKPTMTRYWKEK